jgi:hypothetical protein
MIDWQFKKEIDKVHSDSRARRGSGVYLEEPPFNLPSDEFIDVLEVSHILSGASCGIIRTCLYKPTKW